MIIGWVWQKIPNLRVSEAAAKVKTFMMHNLEESQPKMLKLENIYLKDISVHHLVTFDRKFPFGDTWIDQLHSGLG